MRSEPSNHLSARETEILLLVLDDLSSAQIAARLNISIRTVETHRKNIHHKTGAKSLIALVKWAIRKNLVKGFYYTEE